MRRRLEKSRQSTERVGNEVLKRARVSILPLLSSPFTTLHRGTQYHLASGSFLSNHSRCSLPLSAARLWRTRSSGRASCIEPKGRAGRKLKTENTSRGRRGLCSGIEQRRNGRGTTENGCGPRRLRLCAAHLAFR
uniref:Uncharacterized protein n=1 Tax=Mycena chlorophos TaxID=658473 RepID=A0ABQ0LTS8_MYCCL|nr:predicted protein [Mycena chlorophos]